MTLHLERLVYTSREAMPKQFQPYAFPYDDLQAVMVYAVSQFDLSDDAKQLEYPLGLTMPKSFDLHASPYAGGDVKGFTVKVRPYAEWMSQPMRDKADSKPPVKMELIVRLTYDNSLREVLESGVDHMARMRAIGREGFFHTRETGALVFYPPHQISCVIAVPAES